MGIGSADLEVFIKLREAGLFPDRTSVMEVGAQQLAPSFLSAKDRLEYLGRLFGTARELDLPLLAQADYSRDNVLETTAPYARVFWEWLGLDYAAIDIDGSASSIPLDLNYDDAPAGAKGKYGLVTNFGTTEHVANQLNAFKVIHDLTAHRGIMIHHLPAQGTFVHGLFNYDFKFFWMLGRSNGYGFIFADFAYGLPPRKLPQDILGFLDAYVAAPGKLRDFTVPDAAIVAVMQKNFDIPFVPPIDVPTGARTDIKSLKERYWTVFEPDAFSRLATTHNQQLKSSSGSKRQALEIFRTVSFVSDRLEHDRELSPRRTSDLPYLDHAAAPIAIDGLGSQGRAMR